jgi:hypothetical protein
VGLLHTTGGGGALKRQGRTLYGFGG